MQTIRPPALHCAPALRLRGLFCAALAALALPLACNLPGRPARVLPALSGSGATPAARMTLVVLHRDAPSLHARKESVAAADGTFAFEPIALPVAGQEFGRHYRVYLHHVSSGVDRVVFRANLARRDAEGPIRLDCDLARPIALGEPCRVRDPQSHPWLIAEGRDHFARLCADCHGSDARGGPVPRERSQADRVEQAPDLTRLAARSNGLFDRDTVAMRIEGRSLAPGHARGAMPAWGERLSIEFERYAEGDELVGATLDPLVAYLESLQRTD